MQGLENMAVVFNRAVSPAPVASRRRNGHAKPIAVGNVNFDIPMRLRTGHLMTLFGVSHSTICNRIKLGEIPPPDGKDGRRPYWFPQTIKKYLQP